MRGLKLNTKLITEALIASVLVQNSPLLLQSVAPSLIGQMGGNITGGVLAYLAGMVMKKPNIGNIGIAIALSDFVNSAITPMLTPSTPSVGSLKGLRDYSSTNRMQRLSRSDLQRIYN